MKIKNQKNWLTSLKLLCSILLLCCSFWSSSRHMNQFPSESIDSFAHYHSYYEENRPQYGSEPFKVNYAYSWLIISRIQTENLEIAFDKNLKIWSYSSEWERTRDSLIKNGQFIFGKSLWVFDFAPKIFNLENVSSVHINHSNCRVRISNQQSGKYKDDTISNIDIKSFSKEFYINRYIVLNSDITLDGHYTSFFNVKLAKSSIYNTADWTNVTDSKIEDCNFTFRRGPSVFNHVSFLSNNQIEMNDSLHLYNITGSGNLEIISNAKIPDSIQRSIDDYIYRYGDSKGVEKELKPARLFLSNVDLSKIRVDFGKILLVIDTSRRNRMVRDMYMQVLEILKDNKEERKLYDAEFRKLVKLKENRSWYNLKDFLYRKWNYYGYEPDRIYGIILRAFLLFFAVNILLYPRLLKDGYSISNFEEVYQRRHYYSLVKRFAIEVFYSGLYTLMLFWIFRIELSKLKVHAPLLVSWIVFQHIISLILLTFAVREILM